MNEEYHRAIYFMKLAIENNEAVKVHIYSEKLAYGHDFNIYFFSQNDPYVWYGIGVSYFKVYINFQVELLRVVMLFCEYSDRKLHASRIAFQALPESGTLL